jgi:hypothetical protein
LPRAPTFLALALAALLAGCASDSPPPGPYKLYPGPVRPGSELALLELGDASVIAVDSLLVAREDWNRVLLLPGRHQLDCMVEYGASVWVEPSGFGHASTHLDADLVAGRTYVIHYSRTYGEGYQVWVWLEDAAAGGSVVAGQKKP